jgi:predicted MFS family arabinose efflux permease
VISMVKLPPTETIEKTAAAVKTAQIMQLIKDNQLMTALCLFVLWQAGAFVSAYSYVQGGMC